MSRTAASAAFNKDATGGLSIWFIVIMAALASVATAVFLAQVLSPTGFLSAVRGVEIKAVSRAQWAEMSQSFRSRLANDPVVRKHDAVEGLLALLIEVERGRQTGGDVLPVASSYHDADRDNLVSRLTYAALEDRQSAPAGAARTPMDRFAAIKRIVDAEPRASVAKLYNEELTQAWHEVLKSHFKRADVAASLATSLDHYQIVDHYAALPMIQEQIAAIAVGLRKEGHTAEAEACRRWLGRTLIGLIESEKESGTRLLCVELLSRSDGDSALGASISQLHDDYLVLANRSPTSLIDLNKRPALVHLDYAKAVLWLVVSLCLFVFGCAGFALFVTAFVIYTTRRFTRREIGLTRPLSLKDGLVMSVIVLMSSAPILLNTVHGMLRYGYYSESCVLMRAVAALASGLIAIPLISMLLFLKPAPVFCDASEKVKFARRWMSLLLIGAACWIIPPLFCRIPAPVMAAALRSGDFTFGSSILAALLLGAGLALISIWASHSNLRSLILTAVLSWCIHTPLALLALQLHRSADQQQIQQTVIASADEFAACLGPDWQDKYLKSARAAYDIAKP